MATVVLCLQQRARKSQCPTACRCVAWLASFVTGILFACGLLQAQSYEVTYPASVGAHGIIPGPDGALWFTAGSKIGRISMSGTITEYALPNQASALHITPGPDGAMWFAEVSGNRIGRITTSGAITEFAIPTANAQAFGITAGPDGALWFVEQGGNKIGRITTTGVIAEFPLPTPGSNPSTITAGPDGALWFGEEGTNRIGRITTAGVISEYPIPTADAAPRGITAGPDGAIWFTEARGNKIGRITTAGVVAEWPCGTEPFYIARGPDGALWFTERSANKIGRLTTAGALTEIVLPNHEFLVGIAVGPDGAVWFTGAQRIGRIQLPKSRTGVLSHIAAGALWTTDISLVNTSPAAVTATVRFRTDDGSALHLPFTVTQQGGRQVLTGSSLDTVVQPNATVLISMGDQVVSLLTGSAEVLSAGPLCGYAIFRSTPESGAPSEGTVPLQNQFSSSMILPFDNAGGFVMGVAIANLSSTSETITAKLYDEDGNLLGSQTMTISGNGHTSFELRSQFAVTNGRRGMVFFQSAGSLAGLGLRFSPFNTFTSVPTM